VEPDEIRGIGDLEETRSHGKSMFKFSSQTDCHGKLVGGFKDFSFSIIYGIILPIDFYIFQDGFLTINRKITIASMVFCGLPKIRCENPAKPWESVVFTPCRHGDLEVPHEFIHPQRRFNQQKCWFLMWLSGILGIYPLAI
jgi:hypothetical protein